MRLTTTSTSRAPRAGRALGLAALAASLVLASALTTAGPAGAAASCATVQSLTALDPGGRIVEVDTADDPSWHVQVLLVDGTYRIARRLGNTHHVVANTGSHRPDVSISGDGQVVYFTSQEDHTGENLDGNRELFRWRQNQPLDQVTDGMGGGDTFVRFPSTDDDGSTVVFLGQLPLAGNGDGNAEVIVAEVGAGTPAYTQVTSTTGNAQGTRPDITRPGDRIVFGSRGTQNSNADGSPEVFVASAPAWGSFARTNVSGLDAALTLPTVSFDADGSHLAFAFDGDLTGDNGDRNREIFLARPVGALEQLTDTTTGTSYDPHLNGTGRALTFSTTAAVAGPAGTLAAPVRWGEVGGFTRLGPPASNSSVIAPDGIGSTVLYSSNQPISHGADGSDELYLARCATFPDVPVGHDFWEDVEWMAAAGISTGYADGTYKPASSVSRAAMSAFLYRLAGSPGFSDPPTASFGDVPTNHPFFHEVEWLVAEEITGGYPDGGFHPSAAVTRQSMAAFIYRFADIPMFDPPADPTFTDVPADHPFFREIEWMAFQEISQGYPDGTYKPGAAISRQAMSAFMHRIAPGGSGGGS